MSPYDEVRICASDGTVHVSIAEDPQDATVALGLCGEPLEHGRGGLPFLVGSDGPFELGVCCADCFRELGRIASDTQKVER